MAAKSGWILVKTSLKLSVNDILQVLIVTKSSLRLSAFALKLHQKRYFNQRF